ncbi:MAG: hypothetical protein KF730_11625 [Sphingomonas sp.]|uniref:chaperone modulator CbpM n=1 Tax=Sphingomonas sp. TaxID=28214 RepID=UPI0025D78F24|nr:chaperone modulator CbpM [Sphingomonas sp.]MBX3565209.1 hypothetical protein [Sphingomonas sp.]
MRISIERFVVEAGVERAAVERWVARGWLLLDDDALSDIDAARARFIRDLLGDFGVNEEGVDLVLHLTDQVHGLRAALTAARVRSG